MPRARYIICSSERLVDATTGLVTHVNVIDKMIATGPPEGSHDDVPEIPICHMIMTSVWMKEESDDPEAEYDYEVVVHKPSESPKVVASGDLVFDKKFYRLEVGFRFTTKSKIQNGIVVFESRIRKKGATDWLSQSFPIETELQTVGSTIPEKSAN